MTRGRRAREEDVAHNVEPPKSETAEPVAKKASYAPIASKVTESVALKVTFSETGASKNGCDQLDKIIQERDIGTGCGWLAGCCLLGRLLLFILFIYLLEAYLPLGSHSSIAPRVAYPSIPVFSKSGGVFRCYGASPLASASVCRVCQGPVVFDIFLFCFSCCLVQPHVRLGGFCRRHPLAGRGRPGRGSNVQKIASSTVGQM